MYFILYIPNLEYRQIATFVLLIHNSKHWSVNKINDVNFPLSNSYSESVYTPSANFLITRIQIEPSENLKHIRRHLKGQTR